MEITGGIDTYSYIARRVGDNGSPEGRKVTYLADNGYDCDVDHANRYFHKGQVLTVKEIYVGRSSSEVEFVECPNERFNTVMFADENNREKEEVTTIWR